MAITLHPHQEEALAFLKANPRAILGDRRGVGKTYPALLALWQNAIDSGVRNPHFLYVCPAYQMAQNARKIRDVWPDAKVSIVMRGAQPDPAATWHVVSYHTLTDDGLAKTKWVYNAKWDGIIFDEGHRLRRRQNQWTKNTYQMSRKTKSVYLLTGTPMVKDPGDYWALLRMMDHKKFRSYWNFIEEWCIVKETPWKKEIVGVNPHLTQQFASLLSTYLLRRDITLPAPTEHTISVSGEKEILEAHRNAKKDWIIQYPDDSDPEMVQGGGALVIKLRQLTAFSQAKIQAVNEILEDMPGEQAIVFTWFRKSAERLAKAIEAKGRPVFVATGDLPPMERSALIDQWKLYPDAVLVATIPSVQEGLDLQNAATAIFFEVPYTWSDTDQAIGRVHRTGQTKQVNIHYIRVKGTIDDSVHRIMMKRREGSESMDALMMEILMDLRNSPDWPEIGED